MLAITLLIVTKGGGGLAALLRNAKVYDLRLTFYFTYFKSKVSCACLYKGNAYLPGPVFCIRLMLICARLILICTRLMQLLYQVSIFYIGVNSKIILYMLWYCNIWSGEGEESLLHYLLWGVDLL